MSNILDIDAVNGFEDAWMEMYDTHVVDVSKDWKAPENTVVTRNEDELMQAFEKMYDCKLTQRDNGHHYWYSFDSVAFDSKSAHTMFLLKWS